MLIIMIYMINFSPFCSPNIDMMLTGIKQTNKILKKKLAELKKTHGHLSLPRLHRIIMQRKMRTKVEQIRVVSLKVFIAVPKF